MAPRDILDNNMLLSWNIMLALHDRRVLKDVIEAEALEIKEITLYNLSESI